MKTPIRNLALGALLTVASNVNASQVTVDPGASWLGYMNVSELPSNGGGFVFGSGWGTADLCATWSGPTLTLTPNTIGDPNPFWYTPSGGPGATGNKIMDASMYVEDSASLPGQSLTFTGHVLNNSLVSSYTAVAFIKDFVADYSSFTTVTAPLTPGVFSIELATVGGAGHHVQYGFETIGPDVWVTDVASKGFTQVTGVPEPQTWAIAALMGVAGYVSRRRAAARQTN